MPSDDSDYIDSDTEAYLYSKIHHEFQPIPACDHKPSESLAPFPKNHPEPGNSKLCLKNFGGQRIVTSQNPLYVLPSWSKSWKGTSNLSAKSTNSLTRDSTITHLTVHRDFNSERTSTPKSNCETQPRRVTVTNQCLHPTIEVMYNVELQAEKENRKRPVTEEFPLSSQLMSKRQKSVNLIQKRAKSEDSSDSSDVIIEKWEDGNKHDVVINIDSSTDNSCVVVESENEVEQNFDSSLWEINSQDRFKSEWTRDRLMNVICYNCRDRGHLSKSCKKPKRVESCYLCGEPGHKGDYCPNPMCTQCLLPGHWHYQCLWLPNTIPPCAICNTKGHLCQECPVIWRRYHLTTSSGPFVTSSKFGNTRQNSIFCYNCGLEGHYGYDCTRRRKNSLIFPVNRKVIDYNDPRKLIFNKINTMLWRQKLKLSRKAQRSRHGNFRKEFQVSKSQKLKLRKQKKKVQFMKGVGDIVRLNPDEEESFPRSKKAMKKTRKQKIRQLTQKHKKMSRRNVYHNIITGEYQERI